MAALIEFFEVRPHADAAFLADWQRERGASGATLYRAIRDDVPVRFVSVAAGDTYELVHEDGSLDGAGVFQITAFAEPLLAWQRRHEIETGRQGYLGTRLYHALDDRDHVAITRWSSPLMVYRTAQKPEHQETAFESQSALYTRTNNALRCGGRDLKLGGWDSNPQPNG